MLTSSQFITKGKAIMRMGYGLADFREDLIEMGLLNKEEDELILMTLLDGCLEAWIDHLLMTSDILVSILPNRTTRRTTELICVFGGGVVKIENRRAVAWKDYNGDHYFTNSLSMHFNSEQTIKTLRAEFKVFLKISGLDLLKKRTQEILPAWSVAFVHRMPEQIQSFYFPNL